MRQEKRKRGRQSLYTPQLAAEICRRIASGESLRTICAESEMPSLSCVLDWLDKPEFATPYARARDVQADVMDAVILDTANECKVGKIESRAAAVAIGAYQWRAGRLAPKRYGDRQALEHSGPGGAPLTLEINVRFPEGEGGA